LVSREFPFSTNAHNEQFYPGRFSFQFVAKFLLTGFEFTKEPRRVLSSIAYSLACQLKLLSSFGLPQDKYTIGNGVDWWCV